MKKIAILFIINTVCFISYAQTFEQTMEKRAREMHRVLGLSDKEQWKKFIQENYTQALIDKPMKSKMQRQENDDVSSKEENIKGTIEDKVNMYQRLHDDFGDSKIISIKPTGEQLEMVLSGAGLGGTFNLKFGKDKPYLIDGLGIQIEGGR